MWGWVWFKAGDSIAPCFFGKWLQGLACASLTQPTASPTAWQSSCPNFPSLCLASELPSRPCIGVKKKSVSSIELQWGWKGCAEVKCGLLALYHRDSPAWQNFTALQKRVSFSFFFPNSNISKSDFSWLAKLQVGGRGEREKKTWLGVEKLLL